MGHHEAHSASAYFASPFDEAAVLTLDSGRGLPLDHPRVREGQPIPDAERGSQSPLARRGVHGDHRLAGFHPNADEGKVMGLAPYGTDRYVPELRDLIHLSPDGLFRVNLSGSGTRSSRAPIRSGSSTGSGRRASPSQRSPNTIRTWRSACKRSPRRPGCTSRAHSIRRPDPRTWPGRGGRPELVMNARLLAETPFEHIFIQPAAGDAGNALGAALHVGISSSAARASGTWSTLSSARSTAPRTSRRR